MNRMFWTGLLLAAAGCGTGAGSKEKAAAAERLQHVLLPAQQTLHDYHTAFLQAQLHINSWAMIPGDISDKTEQRNFVNKNYPALREKMAKSIEGWSDDLRGDGKRMLVSGDSLVANYKIVMGIFSGFDAYLGDSALMGRDMVREEKGAVKQWFGKLEGQINKLDHGLSDEISTAVSGLSGKN